MGLDVVGNPSSGNEAKPSSGSQPALATQLTSQELQEAQSTVMLFIADKNFKMDLGINQKMQNTPFSCPPFVKLVQEALNAAMPAGDDLIAVDGVFRPGGKTAEALGRFQEREGFGVRNQAGRQTLAALARKDPRILGAVEQLVGAENMEIVGDLLSGKVELGFGSKNNSSKQFNALLERLLPGEAEKKHGCPATEFEQTGKGTYGLLAQLCSPELANQMGPRDNPVNYPRIGTNVISDIITERATLSLPPPTR